MDDLISRQAAIKAIKTSRFCVDAMEKIIKLPSAQPERKRGKWIYDEDEYGIDIYGYYCDKCRFFLPWDYLINSIEDYNFCPNCGADMKGEDDE